MVNVGKKVITDALKAQGLFSVILHLSFYQIFKYDIFYIIIIFYISVCTCSNSTTLIRIV